MKALILFLVTAAHTSLAASPLVKALDQWDEITKVGSVEYGSCVGLPTPLPLQDDTLYTPQQAIQDINSGNLRYMGRDLISGDQNYTCVYKSDKAYILYNNCMSSRKESSATDIEIISFKGGITRFYILANEGPVSSLPRSGYDVSWRVTSSLSKPPGNLAVSEIKSYMEASSPLDHGMCFMGKTFEAQNMDTEAWCSRLSESSAKEWSEKAEPFWREPGNEWLKTKQKLWETVRTR